MSRILPSPKLQPFPPGSTPLPDGELPEHNKRGCPTLESRAVAVSYRCSTRGCDAYDPTGGGYWPADAGPWLCRDHLRAAMHPPRRRALVP